MTKVTITFEQNDKKAIVDIANNGKYVNIFLTFNQPINLKDLCKNDYIYAQLAYGFIRCIRIARRKQ